jgi:hypothetical protein
MVMRSGRLEATENKDAEDNDDNEVVADAEFEGSIW